MSRKAWVSVVATIFLIALGTVWWLSSGPRMPKLLLPSLPPGCRQALLVLSPEANSYHARLWLMERWPLLGWRPAAGPIAVTLGRSGLAWGVGDDQAAAPGDFRIKREGDGCSPAGVFRIPFAFGTADGISGLKLPYTKLTSTIIGVDDPKSRYYNQIVDNAVVARDWDSNEPMIRLPKLYERGAFIAHNPQGTPGAGSCIFLHLWPGGGESTAGCTAMSAADLVTVLTWLDPAREPRLVQGLESW